jgi:hypothetical protein
LLDRFEIVRYFNGKEELPMGEYQKIPEIVRAWQWSGTTLADARRFVEENGIEDFTPCVGNSVFGHTGLVVETPTGRAVIEKGGWIVVEDTGEIRVFDDEEFRQTYEEV